MSGDCGHGWAYHFDGPSGPCYRCVMNENKKLRSDLEVERMRLAACGVVALADTPETAAKVREMHGDYKSASCDDVARRVDDCIRLRAEVAELRAALKMVGMLRRLGGMLPGTHQVVQSVVAAADAALAKEQP